MKWLKNAVLPVFGGAGLMASVGLLGYLLLFPYDAPAEPPGIRSGLLRVGGLQRTYLYYVPERRPERAPLVIAFHGSGGSGEQMREHTGYRLERLADEHGFVVLYPDGFENHWNDCRARGPYTANTLDVDDPGFVRALIERFRGEYGAGDPHVFALGFSNGGHMAFRLALEMPDEVTAIAAFGANLPAPAELDCTATDEPVAALVVNGTEDPINPYHGGIVTIFGLGNRGEVQSSRERVAYFAERAGHPGSPVATRLPDRDGDAGTWAEVLTWQSGPLPEVTLVTLHGGGHTIPQSLTRFPPLLGPTSTEIDGLAEAWRFFARRMRSAAAMAPSGEPRTTAAPSP